MPWGDTDTGGKARPKATFSGGAIGTPELTFPAVGFVGMDEDWVPEKIVNAAANASRTVSETVVGYRGVFTVRYAYLSASDRRQIARLLNIGGRVYFYPHSDDARNYLCRMAATTGIMQQLDGRAIGYGPLTITFETVSLRSSVPCLTPEQGASHFSDKDEAYDPADEICCFTDKYGIYDPDDKIGWFNAGERGISTPA